MIKVSHLSKHYSLNENKASLGGLIQTLGGRTAPRMVKAIDEVSFNIEAGTICGVVGLNGAGKSTLIKMLTGVIKSSSGECQVGEWQPFDQRISYVKNIGVVFGQRTQMLWDLPVRYSLQILQPIYQVPKLVFEKNLEAYTQLFGVDEFINQPVRTLSLGQRMRAELVSALLHDPSVLFLDEPTIGLDVVVKQQIRQAIATLNRNNGTTVIITSHDLDDIDSLCSQLIILDKGKVRFDGAKQAFIDEYRSHKKICFELAETPHELMLQRLNMQAEGKQRFSIVLDDPQSSIATVIQNVVTEMPVLDLTIQEQSLEDIVQSIY